MPLKRGVVETSTQTLAWPRGKARPDPEFIVWSSTTTTHAPTPDIDHDRRRSRKHGVCIMKYAKGCDTDSMYSPVIQEIRAMHVAVEDINLVKQVSEFLNEKAQQRDDLEEQMKAELKRMNPIQVSHCRLIWGGTHSVGEKGSGREALLSETSQCSHQG